MYADSCQGAKKAVNKHKAKAQCYRDENHSLRKEIEILKFQLDSQVQLAPTSKGKERACTLPPQLLDYDIEMMWTTLQMTRTLMDEYRPALKAKPLTCRFQLMI